MRIEILAEGDRLPILPVLALGGSGGRIQVPLEQHFIQLLRRGRVLIFSASQVSFGTVIGWAMDPRLTVDLAEQAFRMALTTRLPEAGLLHHSDRGSQYAAWQNQQMLTTHGITPSMSRIGNSWDNACVESFFGTLKRNSCTIDTMPHEPKTRRTSFEYIEVSMIGTRHSALGYHSPVEYGSRAAVA